MDNWHFLSQLQAWNMQFHIYHYVYRCRNPLMAFYNLSVAHALMVHHALASCRLYNPLVRLWTNSLCACLVHALTHSLMNNLFSSNFPLVRLCALSMPFHMFSHMDHMNKLCHIYQNPSSIPLNPLTSNLVSSIALMNDNRHHHNLYHNHHHALNMLCRMFSRMDHTNMLCHMFSHKDHIHMHAHILMVGQ